MSLIKVPVKLAQWFVSAPTVPNRIVNKTPSKLSSAPVTVNKIVNKTPVKLPPAPAPLLVNKVVSKTPVQLPSTPAIINKIVNTVSATTLATNSKPEIATRIDNPSPNVLLETASGIINNLTTDSEDNSNINILGAIKSGGNLLNTFKNPKSLLTAAKSDALGSAMDTIRGTPIRNTLFNFPVTTTNPSSTISTISGRALGATSVTGFEYVSTADEPGRIINKEPIKTIDPGTNTPGISVGRAFGSTSVTGIG